MTTRLDGTSLAPAAEVFKRDYPNLVWMGPCVMWVDQPVQDEIPTAASASASRATSAGSSVERQEPAAYSGQQSLPTVKRCQQLRQARGGGGAATVNPPAGRSA